MSKSQKGCFACFQTPDCVGLVVRLIFLLWDWFVLAFFSFQFAFASWCPHSKTMIQNFACKKCASEHFVAVKNSGAASPSFPYFHRFDFPSPKKPKVPTVTRDIIYGWARGLVGPLLLDCFAPSTFTHKAGGRGDFVLENQLLLVCGRSLIGIAGGFFFKHPWEILKHNELGEAVGVLCFFVLKYFDFQGRMLRFCLEDFFATKHSFQEFCCQILVGEVFDGFPCRQWSLDWRFGPLVPWGVLGGNCEVKWFWRLKKGVFW